MSAAILVVDDEPAIRHLLAAVLTRGGFTPHLAVDARSALALAGQHLAAAIVDLGLPDRDGLELVAAFAARNLPTLVLSARLETADKVVALDLGAEDYLTKPFDGDELLARVRAMLRRGERLSATRDWRSDGGVLAFGAFRIDPSFHRATLDERMLDLTPREFALLSALVSAGGRVLTHRTLLTNLWGAAHADNVEYLRVAIRALRRKIEPAPSAPTLILNEPGIGYRVAIGIDETNAC